MPPSTKTTSSAGPTKTKSKPAMKSAEAPVKPASGRRAGTVKHKDDRLVLYPKVEALFYLDSPDCLGPLTVEVAQKLLGWETEAQYILRKKAEPECPIDVKDEEFAYGNDFLIQIGTGEITPGKVRCLRNLHNRRFRESYARTYGQDILNRYWADSRNGGRGMYRVLQEDGVTVKDEELTVQTYNGEDIIIGRYGNVVSGQHRLIGLVLAHMKWADKIGGAQWRKKWGDTPPSIECIVKVGISEDDEVIRTIDNVIPRGLDDVGYTMSIFAKDENGEPRPKEERVLLSRMYAAAIDLLWNRTRDERLGTAEKYRTHGGEVDFFNRHGRLKEMILHVHAENKPFPWNEEVESGNKGEIIKHKAENNISGLHLSPGQVASMAYLMAASGMSGPQVDDYYLMKPPSEKGIDFTHWDKAQEWVVELAKGMKGRLKSVVESMAACNGDPGWAECGPDEKLAIMVLSWEPFLSRKKGDVPLKDVLLGGKLELTNASGIPTGEVIGGRSLWVINKNDKLVLREHPKLDGIDNGKEVPKEKAAVGNGEEVAGSEVESEGLENPDEEAEEEVEARMEAEEAVKAEELAESQRQEEERLRTMRAGPKKPAPNNRMGGLAPPEVENITDDEDELTLEEEMAEEDAKDMASTDEEEVEVPPPPPPKKPKKIVHKP